MITRGIASLLPPKFFIFRDIDVLRLTNSRGVFASAGGFSSACGGAATSSVFEEGSAHPAVTTLKAQAHDICRNISRSVSEKHSSSIVVKKYGRRMRRDVHRHRIQYCVGLRGAGARTTCRMSCPEIFLSFYKTYANELFSEVITYTNFRQIGCRLAFGSAQSSSGLWSRFS